MRPLSCLVSIVLLAMVSELHAENWPQWRGPSGDGVTHETALPLEWGESQHVRWKAPLAGLGTSSPIVWGDRIFVTSQLGMGPLDRRGAEFDDAVQARDYGSPSGVEFLVQAFDRTGASVWQYRLPKGSASEALPAVHPKHSLASPSVVTDGKRVYAWMGNGQFVALTLDGELAWARDLAADYAPFDVLWGHGSSPLLLDETVILLCDHPGGAYMLALDVETGRERWKVDRGSGIRSYSTPFLASGASGDELIVNGSHRLESFDPETGELLWYAGEKVTLAIGMPVRAGQTLYASRGYSSGPYFAIELGGRGDVNESHVKWHVPTRAPYISSLIYYENLLFMATERGVASAVDPETGETLWRERLGGAFTASPVAGDGKVYLTNEAGSTFVLEPSVPPKVLSRNELDERVLASPAISNGTIFVRSDAHLIAIR